MVLSGAGGSYAPTRLAYDTTQATGTLFDGSTPQLIDVNHDGLVDIVSASGSSVPGEIDMFLNSGSATGPAFPVTPKENPVGDIPLDVTMADFNCDGKLDIASASAGCTQSTQGCTNSVDQPPALWSCPRSGRASTRASPSTCPPTATTSSSPTSTVTATRIPRAARAAPASTCS